MRLLLALTAGIAIGWLLAGPAEAWDGTLAARAIRGAT